MHWRKVIKKKRIASDGVRGKQDGFVKGAFVCMRNLPRDS